MTKSTFTVGGLTQIVAMNDTQTHYFTIEWKPRGIEVLPVNAPAEDARLYVPAKAVFDYCMKYNIK